MLAKHFLYSTCIITKSEYLMGLLVDHVLIILLLEKLSNKTRLTLLVLTQIGLISDILIESFIYQSNRISFCSTLLHYDIILTVRISRSRIFCARTEGSKICTSISLKWSYQLHRCVLYLMPPSMTIFGLKTKIWLIDSFQRFWHSKMQGSDQSQIE